MKQADRINNLLSGLWIAKRAEAILLFTPKPNKKRKHKYSPKK